MITTFQKPVYSILHAINHLPLAIFTFVTRHLILQFSVTPAMTDILCWLWLETPQNIITKVYNNEQR
ncbi:MAG: hypothetical protein ABIN94_18435 [Ferruginibacter sp.]